MFPYVDFLCCHHQTSTLPPDPTGSPVLAHAHRLIPQVQPLSILGVPSIPIPRLSIPGQFLSSLCSLARVLVPSLPSCSQRFTFPSPTGVSRRRYRFSSASSAPYVLSAFSVHFQCVLGAHVPCRSAMNGSMAECDFQGMPMRHKKKITAVVVDRHSAVTLTQ